MRLSIFIDFRYNQLILSIVIECYRLPILSIVHVGCKGVLYIGVSLKFEATLVSNSTEQRAFVLGDAVETTPKSSRIVAKVSA